MSTKLTGRAGMKIFTYSWVRLREESDRCEGASRGASARTGHVHPNSTMNKHDTTGNDSGAIKEASEDVRQASETWKRRRDERCCSPGHLWTLPGSQQKGFGVDEDGPAGETGQ